MKKILISLMLGIFVLTGCQTSKAIDQSVSVQAGENKYTIEVPGQMISQYKLKNYTDSEGIKGTTISFANFDLTDNSAVSKLTAKSKTVMLAGMPFTGDLDTLNTEDLGEVAREIEVNGVSVPVYEMSDDEVKMLMITSIYKDPESQSAFMLSAMTTNVDRADLVKYYDEIVQSIRVEKTAGQKSDSSITEITYSQFKEMLDRKEDFAFYVGSTTCSACISYRPILEDYIKTYGEHFYYIDVDFAFNTAKEQDQFFKDYLKTDDPLTPTSAVVKKGQIEKVVIGRLSLEEVVQFVKGE